MTQPERRKIRSEMADVPTGELLAFVMLARTNLRVDRREGVFVPKRLVRLGMVRHELKRRLTADDAAS